MIGFIVEYGVRVIVGIIFLCIFIMFLYMFIKIGGRGKQ